MAASSRSLLVFEFEPPGANFRLLDRPCSPINTASEGAGHVPFILLIRSAVQLPCTCNQLPFHTAGLE